MRATAEACQPEDSSGIINASEEINEEGTKVVLETNKKDENVKVTTKDNK